MEKSEMESFDNIKEMAQLDEFLQLCHRAQSLVWDAILHIKDFDVTEITLDGLYPNGQKNLTPIEQCFSVANDIFGTYSKKVKLMLLPQYEIEIDKKIYRADFLADYVQVKNDLCQLEKPIVIECDGYAYHSTKEQRNRDTERENNLKLNGYSIIRFTGSQIYKDPYKCAKQAIEYTINVNTETLKNYLYGIKG